MNRICEIQEAVARQYNVSITELLSARRSAYVCLPRHIAMYLARELTLHSLPAIGRKFGDRDHTTVMSACHRIEKRVQSDPEVHASVEKLRGELA